MTETIHDPLSMVNLLRPDILSDPYPFYHRLRAADAVHWDAEMGYWVLTRYADVVAALRSPQFSSVRAGQSEADWLPPELHATLGPVARAIMRQMLFLDPPDHTRLRGLVNRAFTPRAVDAMRNRIQGIVDDLLDGILASGQGRLELIEDFAYPLPAIVIAEVFGVPPEDRDQFLAWSADFGLLIDEIKSEDAAMRAMYGVAEFIAYFRRIIDERRSRPKDDVLGALIEAEEQGDRLSDDELMGNCILLLAAGHGTTTNLLGNGLLALLRHPEQLALLRDNPEVAPSAVAELLRFDGPVQITGRLATADVEIDGRQIRAGQAVTMSLGAANRDPEQFPDPDRLDLTRPDNRHLAFGYGIHFCVGAPLARLEAEIAFGSLVRRLPGLRLDAAELTWDSSIVFRGLTRLPLNFEPG
jgi:cytochrome P450